MSLPPPHHGHDRPDISIRLEHQRDASLTTRHNFYIAKSTSSPLPSPTNTAPPPHTSTSRAKLDREALRSATRNPRLSDPPPLSPLPLVASQPALTSTASRAEDSRSPTSPGHPPSPNRVKGTSGDKDFDSLKAAASRHALLDRQREDASRARKDGLKLQKRGMVGTTSASPFPTTNGTPSPRLPALGSASSAPIALRLDDGGQRTASSDSTVSLSRSPSQSYAQIPVEDPASVDIPALIAASGSPEAAIKKLLHEKHVAAQNNAQLWRLLNKQRTVMADLNKDFLKATKDRDRYRKRFKEQLAVSESAAQLGGAVGLADPVDRDATASPVTSEVTLDQNGPAGRKASITSDVLGASSSANNTPPPRETYQPPSSSAPSTNAMYATPMAAPFADLRTEPQTADRRSNPGPSQQTVLAREHPLKSRTAAGPPLQSATQGFSATPRENHAQTMRRAPPAPLDLAPHVHKPQVDRSSSIYGDDSSAGSASADERGRKPKRTPGELEKSTEGKQHGNGRHQESARLPRLQKPDEVPPSTRHNDLSSGNLSPISSDGYSAPDSPGSPHVASVQTYQSLNAFNTSVKTPFAAESRVDIRRLPLENDISNPGLPLSPRPTHPTVQALSAPSYAALPTSPRDVTTVLTPRAPKQPLPAPSTAPLSLLAQRSARIESESEHLAPQTPDDIRTTLLSPGIDAAHRPAAPATAPPPGFARTPGEIYRGFMNDQYPDLLLPPTSLHAILIKVDSSRLRPSRHSYMAPKQSEENPVFSLSINSRFDSSQLWRIEKTLAALAQLDSQLKTATKLKLKLPDKALFTGHAPARIDARRLALAAYFDHILDSPLDEQAAGIVCAFLSTDAIGAEAQDYFQPAHITTKAVDSNGRLKIRPRKDGYLTKKGKNFGGWKARYFVLDGPSLKYFEAPGGALLGVINLQYASIGRQTAHAQVDVEEENQFRHAFLVLEPKRRDRQSHVKHVLCAESDEERDHWVQCLMQYVESDDYARPKTAKSTNEKPTSPGSPRMHKSMGDMKKQNAALASSGSSESQNQLRAVMYDSTTAAEAPQIGLKPNAPSPTASQAGSHGDGSDLSGSLSVPAISGPTNGAKIQDAGSWGNRREPNVLRKKEDEKSAEKDKDKDKDKDKERKRSIFTFKGRPSTDSSRDSTSQLPLPEHSGSRANFGVPLADLVDSTNPTDAYAGLPPVVYRCLEFLHAKDAIMEQGIFRMSGSNVVIKALKERFDNEGDVNLLAPGEKEYDIHAVASLLKLFLRELPSSILTRELHLDFIKCVELEGRTKLDAFNVLVNRLPPPNRELLDKLTAFLRDIIDNEQVNKMNVRNVGIVFAPTLNIPAPLISLFVTDHDTIFGAPVDIDTIRDRLPQLLSNPSAATNTAVGAGDARTPKRSLFPDVTTPTGLTPQQLKQQYDMGYVAPPLSGTRPPLKPGLSADNQRKTSQPLQRSLSTASLSRNGSRPASRDKWAVPTAQGNRHVSAESAAPLESSHDNDNVPGSAQHTSFHSMHFPDPPTSARLPPVSPLSATLAATRAQPYMQSGGGSPISPPARSSNSSASTLMNGFPAGFQRDSHASVSQPIHPGPGGANARQPQRHRSQTEYSSAGTDASRMNSSASTALSGSGSAATAFNSNGDYDSSKGPSRAASVTSGRTSKSNPPVMETKDWSLGGAGFTSVSLPQLLDVDISSSPFMGGTSPELSRTSDTYGSSYAPPQSSFGAGVTTVSNRGFGSGPLSGSQSAGQFGSTPSSLGREQQYLSGSASQPVGRTMHGHPAAPYHGGFGDDGRNGDTMPGPGTPQQDGFGRRLLRRQSGKFLVKAGLLDEKGHAVHAAAQHKGFVPGEVAGSPRNGGFARRD